MEKTTPKTMSEVVKSSMDMVNKYLPIASELMSEEMYAQHKKLLERFERAKVMREQRYKYYDGMTYTEDYATNEDLKNTYLTPKMNDSEVRVNTGTSEKKLDAVKNELMTMNLKVEIRAFDQDDMEIQDLGDDMGDMVYRSEEMEKEDDVWEEALDELLSQRIVYVRETFQPRTYKRGTETVAIAKKEIVSGLQVFPGDWTMPAYRWDEQPYICTYDRVTYEQAKSVFGEYNNFKYVSPNNATRHEYLGGAFSYRFGELQDGEVEIITYESLPDDEKQIYVNGVPMCNPGTKLDGSYPKYSLRAYTSKAMSRRFLAGRPMTSMAKTMQGISNETIRLMLRKFQQVLEPPMATPKSGKIYSSRIFDPGSWSQGLRKADFEKLIDHQGVTQGEFSMYNLIEQKIEEFIGTPNIAQGIQGSREMSATEVITMQKQFLKQLGGIVAALMRMKRDLTEIRTYTILENYLDPIKRKVDDFTGEIQDVYRSFTVENTSFPNGRKGKKVIKLFSRDINEEEQKSLYDFEEDESEKGNNVRIKFVNVKKLKTIPINWFFLVYSEDKEGTAFDKITFQDQLNQGATVSKLTGKQMNPDVVTDAFEKKWKAKDWFNVPAPKAQAPMGAEQGGEDISAGAQNLMKEIEAAEQSGGDSLGEQVPRGLRAASTSANQNVAAQEAASAM